MVNRRETVELHCGYWYDCHLCNSRNFVTPGPPELTDDEIEELRTDHGVQPWETGDFTFRPRIVVCEHCKAELDVDDDQD